MILIILERGRSPVAAGWMDLDPATIQRGLNLSRYDFKKVTKFLFCPLGLFVELIKKMRYEAAFLLTKFKIIKINNFRGNIRSRDSGDGASFETIDQVHIHNIRKDSETDRR